MFKSLALLAAVAACFFSVPASAAPAIGEAAPDFSAKDIDGADVSLAALKGKTVVLEWTNHGCPFVVKHYDSKNMQNLQKKWTDKGVTWISIVSSAAGKEGHITIDEAKKMKADQGSAFTNKILDADGAIGKLYDAKTTPHMFVINPEGVLVYKGAIDDNPSPRISTVDGAKNYVDAALTALAEDKPVETAESEAYGCSVKYAK